MFKKLLLVGAIVLVGAWAYGSGVGREAFSYIRTGWSELRSHTKSCVPISFEIKRAEDMLANLDRTDDRLISALAGQIQLLKRMDSELETMHARLDDMKADLAVRNDDLKAILVKGGSDVERETKAIALEAKFKNVRTTEALVKAKLEARDQTQERLNYIKEQREGLKAQRVELQNRIAALKTNVELLKLSETRSKAVLDDDQLAEVSDLKRLVDTLEERIGSCLIEHQLRMEDQKGAPAAPGKSGGGRVSPTGITSEVDSFFGRTDIKVASDKK
jgi:chromosome segregation ATPase